MIEYEILPGMYICPTPAGAYYAVSSPLEDPSRTILNGMLRKNESQIFSTETLKNITGISNDYDSLEQIYRLQNLGLVTGLRNKYISPQGSIETVMPKILADLAGRGKALLSDQEGFYLATHGFHHETAEELAGLSADLCSMHARHAGLLEGNLGLTTCAWALTNAGGTCEVGFWPIFIENYRFVLVISGAPILNQTAMLDMAWGLSRRYSKNNHNM